MGYFADTVGARPGSSFVEQLWWMVAHRLMPRLVERLTMPEEERGSAGPISISFHETDQVWATFCSKILEVHECAMPIWDTYAGGVLDELPNAIGVRLDRFQPGADQRPRL